MAVVDHISTALGIAAQGSVTTLAPAYVAPLARHFGLQMRPVVQPEAIRQVCLYSPARREPSPSAQGFAEFLAQWLPGWEGNLGRGKPGPPA